MEGEGGEEGVVVGAEGEVKGDEATTKVVSIQTWNLWRGAGALEEVGTGGMVARRVTGEAGTGDMVGLKAAVAKKEMAEEETPEMKEVGRGVATSKGTREVKAGRWEEIQVTTGGEMGKGQGKERGVIQGGQAVAPVRQGVEVKEVIMEDLGEGETVCKVSSRRQGHQGVGQVVEVASPWQLQVTRSGRNSRRGRSLQGSSWSAFVPP